MERQKLPTVRWEGILTTKEGEDLLKKKEKSELYASQLAKYNVSREELDKMYQFLNIANISNSHLPIAMRFLEASDWKIQSAIEKWLIGKERLSEGEGDDKIPDLNEWPESERPYLEQPPVRQASPVKSGDRGNWESLKRRWAESGDSDLVYGGSLTRAGRRNREEAGENRSPHLQKIQISREVAERADKQAKLLSARAASSGETARRRPPLLAGVQPRFKERAQARGGGRKSRRKSKRKKSKRRNSKRKKSKKRKSSRRRKSKRRKSSRRRRRLYFS